MMQLPDFKEKQIVFIDTCNFDACDIKLQNHNLVIKENDVTKNKIPLVKIIAVFIVGEMTITSALLQKLMRTGASVYFLKRNCETYASIAAYAEGNYLLRQKQYALDEKTQLCIAKNIVKNKLRNSLVLLRSVEINNIHNKTRIEYKKMMYKKIEKAENIASLRGVEGVVSKDFFQLYFGKIDWYKRMPRSRVDENNILLDMGYSYLFHFMDSLLRVYGFDTYKGVYHTLFFQRKSLACDMMEPFRCIIDRALVKMYTLGQFDKKDFNKKKGKYYLSYKQSAKYSAIFLKEILRYKEEMYQYVRDHYYLILKEEDDITAFIIR